MGLIVSTELAWPRLGYDECYDKRSGWALKLTAKSLHERTSSWGWEKHKHVAVARGYSLGLRQFATMHDAHDANFGTTWLLDATKGIEFVKQELGMLCGVDTSRLAIIVCPRISTPEMIDHALHGASYYIKVQECTDSDLLDSPRFLVVDKQNIVPSSIGMLVMNCVDMHGSFLLLCAPGEPIETVALKVQYIHDACFISGFETEYDNNYDNLFDWSFQKAFVIVTGRFVEPPRPTRQALCKLHTFTNLVLDVAALNL